MWPVALKIRIVAILGQREPLFQYTNHDMGEWKCNQCFPAHLKSHKQTFHPGNNIHVKENIKGEVMPYHRPCSPEGNKY